jgi:predicted RNase H-like nuclease (RuvC/YqgF family)
VSESVGGETTDRQALARLERAVGGLLSELDHLREQASRGDVRVRDLEDLLRRFTKGEDDPARLLVKVAELEEENSRLKERIHEGREGVERLLARIRFLEDQR